MARDLWGTDGGVYFGYACEHSYSGSQSSGPRIAIIQGSGSH
jgi:hypothetical protein